MIALHSTVLCVTMTLLLMHGFQSASAQESSGAKSSAPAAVKYPQDVDTQSRFRLPLRKREDLDDDGKKVYDFLAGPNAGIVRGPNAIRLYSPKVAEHMYIVNQYLRNETGLGGRLTELAILVATREANAQTEWTGHEPAALRAGLEQQIIDIIKYRKPIAGMGEKEAVIIRLGREMLSSPKVSSETFADAQRLFGKKGLVELVILMANYSATGAMLRAFDMQLGSDQKPLLPIP